MNQSWEDKFRTWARPPGQTEEQRCQNALQAIRNALNKSARLNRRDITVFAQGSYRNNTNVRQDSDVDVGIVCRDSLLNEFPEGYDRTDFGLTPADYHYSQFKDEIGEALVAHFGAAAVKRGNKAFDIKETNYHVEADVAPFFEHRRYNTGGGYITGVALIPDNGMPPRVYNWPEQHYENGVSKNNTTGRRFKGLVRILKSLRNEMDEQRIQEAAPIMGFLSECLVWNVPNSTFGNDTYWEELRQILIFLFNNTKTQELCQEWGEVSELKYLFRSSQKWTRQQAHNFILRAWQYVGYT